MVQRRGKKWEKVKAHKSLNPSRNKTQETTEEIQKNSRDTENNEIRDLPVTVNMTHVTDNRKARKRKASVDVVKVTQTQPLVSEIKSCHFNENNGESQVDIEKNISLLMKDENLNSSRIATLTPKIINNTSIVSSSSDAFRKSGDFETFDTQDREFLDILEELGNV